MSAEEDARDAARYRWLRQQEWHRSTIAVVVEPKVSVRLGHDLPNRERLDEMIDRLMLGKVGPDH